MTNITIGKIGETKAKEHLLQNGFIILEQNYRYKNLEIDIVATKDNVLYFVEVKTRRQKKFGDPIEAVNRKKINNIKKVANEYLETHPTQYATIQIDVLGIQMHADKVDVLDIVWTKDVF